MARHKFRIGDTIIPIASSNEEYNITNERNGCVARVIDVDHDREEDIEVRIIKLKNNSPSVGEEYWVSSDHFILLKDNSTTKRLMEGKK